ncbi:MAG: PilW family protein [Xanthomonadales bacterium]|nr:PilW family protein [Xanthomonadales bacterium]
MNALARHLIRKTGGFTLVELLVALVIGLVVLGAVIGMYQSNSQAARFQNGMLRVQENGRFATDTMGRVLRMAGYNDPWNSVEVSTPVVLGSEGSSGAAISQTDLSTNGDTLAVRFEGGTNILNCQGAAVSLNSWVTNQYAINTNNQLVCATITTDSALNTTTSNNQTLAEGVEDMVVFYGLDVDTDGVADRYVSASDVSNWDHVASIQVTFLVNSVENAVWGQDNVCIGCSVFSGSADNLIRAEFQTTVGLRN